MLTIICGTNRKDSMTSKVANTALQLAQSADIECTLIDLSTLDSDYIHSSQYSPDALPDWLKEIQAKSFIAADHFLWISPEYNGSYPGYLKLFIDAMSVHKLKESFAGKHSALIGVASGRAGNLRGMDHLTSVLNHIGSTVVPGSLPISGIGSIINAEGEVNEDTKGMISGLIDKLMKA